MIRKEEQGKTDSLLYWQQYIFISLMVTVDSLGLSVLIIGVYQFIQEKMILVGISLILFYLLFVFMTFARFIKYKIRHRLIAWTFYSLSITILIFTGPRGASQLYLCTAYVLLLLQPSSRQNGLFLILVNIIVFTLLSIFYYSPSSVGLPIREYGIYWWLIVANILTVNVFIVQMISLIMKGLDRRYKKAKWVNKNLLLAQENNLRQISLLKNLRQTGMVAMETRLSLEDRLQAALGTIQEVLQSSMIDLSITRHNSDESICIASLPEDHIGLEFVPPEVSGPYLLYNHLEVLDSYHKTNLMKLCLNEELYFAGRFFTPRSTGYLELILKKPPEEWELNFIQMILFQLSATITNDQLFQDLQNSRDTLLASYDEILQAWAMILELRDIETKGHSSRVVSICLNIAEMVGLPEEDRIQLKRGAFLHDIGKLGIPDRILKKEGPLTDEEWKIMRNHPVIGRDSVIHIPFLKPAVPVIYHHHEKWDGNGYPAGLAGEEIPYTARIFMIADVYDALISDRPYRKAMPQEEIIEYMTLQRERFFDPDLLDIFLENIEDMIRVREMEDLEV